MTNGLLTPDGDGENLASMADWYDMKNLDISGEAGDVTIATKYPGLLCKGFSNHGAATATIIGTTICGSDFTIKLPIGAHSGKLPIIATLTKATTSDDITLYFQKKTTV